MRRNTRPVGARVHEACRMEMLEPRLLLAGADISVTSVAGDGLHTLLLGTRSTGATPRRSTSACSGRRPYL